MVLTLLALERAASPLRRLHGPEVHGGTVRLVTALPIEADQTAEDLSAIEQQLLLPRP
jgi:hypothetical protein